MTVRRRAQCAAFAGWVLLCAAWSQAQPQVRQVLMLQSFDRGGRTLDEFTANFRVDLEERSGTPVNVVQLSANPTGIVGAPERSVVDYIRATYAERPKPDLIVTIGGPAATFARKHRPELFPEKPILFAALDQRYLRVAPLADNETAVAVDNDFPQLVDDILKLLPQTKQVFMVTGSGPLSRFWRPPLEEQFSQYAGRLTFIWSNDQSLQEILRNCAHLPRDSVILYLFLVQDSQGGTYADERVLAELHATANAPLFANHTVMLGHGIVGGRLLSIEDLSRTTAGAAVRLLNGEPPASVRLPLQLPGPPTFDWRELQRWGIAESRLPPGSVFVYRPPSLWQEHKRTVLGVAGALALQAILIVGLLYQRRARRRAEMESRRNLVLAADASRRQTVSALASSMAHDLGQPISSIIHNAQALDGMIAADRATPETIVEVLSDIRSQGAQAAQIIDRHRTMLKSRQLERKPIDLHGVVSECLALMAHDMSARQIQATVNLSSTPCVISGDPVLLQQVLVNLVMNAMDAMVQTPAARRRVTIGTEVRGGDAEVVVRDTGTGLPAQMNGALFTPFATTKAHGLGIGLSIARTIVEAHDGSIEAHNNPDGGATFIVRLRRAQQPSVGIGGSVG